MTKEQFNYLCEKLGDPELPVDERWKSIQYIHIHGSYEPAGSFREMYMRDQIYYYDDPTLGPGFFYLSTPDASMDPLMDGYTISWLGLDVISEITFRGFSKYKSLADQVYGISDIMRIALGKEVLPLPTYVSIDPVLIKKKDAQDYEIQVKSTRPITRNDFDITYYDSMGNQLPEKPIKIGDYKVKVTCKGNYIGEAETRYKIIL